MRVSIFFFLIVYAIQVAFSTSSEDTNQDLDNYELKNTCTFDLKRINVYQTIGKGEKGYRGHIGLPGPKGHKGERGWPGEKGDVGAFGTKGELGEVGEKGEKGTPGLPGLDGLPGYRGLPGMKGDKGEMGLPGPPGERGSDGIMGVKGDRGDKGFRGIPGVDNCPSPQLLPVSCKDAVFDDPEITIRVRHENPFVVQCKKFNGADFSTCLKPNITTNDPEVMAMRHLSQPFWLSERIADEDNALFSLKDFYFGYTFSQIEFLQTYSSVVKQKIRYHCKNSHVVPQDEDDIQEKALRLLTWKELLIGPYSSSESPFHYNIIEDGCKNSTNAWSYTDIELISDRGWLPIRDFQIRETQTCECVEKKFYIELLELCFIS